MEHFIKYGMGTIYAGAQSRSVLISSLPSLKLGMKVDLVL